jgi:hypothetical protein
MCPKRHTEKFPWHTAFNAAPSFFISFAQPASLYCAEYVCIHISDFPEIVYKLPIIGAPAWW